MCVCVCAAFERPDFWRPDLAVTASDDRGSGEITPGTPKEALIARETESWTACKQLGYSIVAPLKKEIKKRKKGDGGTASVMFRHAYDCRVYLSSHEIFWGIYMR